MDRYNRNILIEKIGESGQQKLLCSKILVAGAGGLGSTVIANLASAGIGTLGIVDNDKLEITNLNRQYIHKFKNIDILKIESAKEWIYSYNEDIKVETYNLRMDRENGEKIIPLYDIVIDCFDPYESKFSLNEMCIKFQKPLIHGGITEFSGQVTTIKPGESACLNCIIPDYDDTYVPKGVISPAVSTIASIQSMEAIKLILNIGELLINKLLIYDGLEQNFRKINLTKLNCNLCKIKAEK